MHNTEVNACAASEAHRHDARPAYMLGPYMGAHLPQAHCVWYRRYLIPAVCVKESDSFA